MNKRLAVLALRVLLAAPLLLAGCATGVLVGSGQGGYHDQTGSAAETRRDDARLIAEVTRRLVEDRQVAAMNIEVRADGGRVTLSGRVATGEMARRAEFLTRSVDGVRGVENLLLVAP